ncbi:hypothetical protein ES708_26949 [subsurface metagenome]
MKSKRIYLVVFLAFLAIVSCDPNRVYEEYVEIPLHVWDVDNKPVFRPYISDTVASHNIYIDIRNGSGYSYRNLYINVNPDKIFITIFFCQVNGMVVVGEIFMNCGCHINKT